MGPVMKTRNPNTALKAIHDKGGTLRTRDLIALGAKAGTGGGVKGDRNLSRKSATIAA